MTTRNFILILAISSLYIHAQERCGTEVITNQMIAANPDYAQARLKVNSETERWIKSHPDKNKTIITIPVVVHVVWRTNTHNISDAQIQSQIDILNQDYRKNNIDTINTPSIWQGIAADCEIEFCLAKTDPNGLPTTGIERTQTTHGKFGMNSDIHTSIAGGADDWPNDDYLNIWVCDIQNGLLGYATLPSSSIGDGDGLVIGYKYFGNTGSVQPPYNKGRTATHEIGHWLNLEHLWGSGNCGNDQVSDTPKQEQENYSCPGFPLHIDACNTLNPNGNMFMNYMDYTNDACMNLFTNGQKNRMLAAINNYRPNMLSHNLCEGITEVSEQMNNTRSLIKIVDLLGREVNIDTKNNLLFYIYSDGHIEKKMIIK